MTFVWNIVIGMRLALAIRTTFDGNFKWLVSGQLTADASLFSIMFVFLSGAYVAHIVLICQTDDLVFLCSAALRMSKNFSSTPKGHISFKYDNTTLLDNVLIFGEISRITGFAAQ